MKHYIKKNFSSSQFAVRFPKQGRKFLTALILFLLLPALLFTNQSALAQTATPAPYHIISGNVGVPWATLIFYNSQTVMADANGNYSLTVQSLSGIGSFNLVPSREGYSFSPAYISYTDTTVDHTNQNFTATFLGEVSSGSYHSCWLKTNGTVACWGNNSYGETTPPSETFRQLSSGSYHTCGIKTDNTVACWGENVVGQITPPSGTFAQISTSQNHTCGVKTDGSVACWGSNNSGESTPPSGSFVQVSAGVSHTCGVRDDTQVICWGSNTYGQSTIPWGGLYRRVSAGQTHTCALRLDVTVCWGAGTTNTGTFPNFGQAIPLGGTYQELTSGALFTCQQGYGYVACWGDNSWGQTTTPNLTDFAQISAGATHVCGLRTNNTVLCWGSNYNGQSQPITIQGKAVPGTTLSYTDGVSKTVSTDSNGNFSIAVSYNWSGTLTPSKSGTTFTPASKSYTNLIANPASQTFSVVTTFTSNGTDDGWVLESTQTSGVGGSMDSTSNTFAVGDDAANRQYRGILSFDTSSLPDYAVVQSVTLRIRQNSQVGDNNPMNGSNMRIDIAQGPFSTAYALQLADFEAAPSGDTIAMIAINSTPDANGWYSALFNATGKSLINLTNKTQLRLRFGLDDNNDATADFLKFYSGSYAGGSHPELIITYTIP